MRTAILSLLAAALTLPAAAQSTTEDYTTAIGVNYSYLNADVGQHGVGFNFAYLPTPKFGVFADLSFHGGSGNIAGIDLDTDTQHFLFGPRVYFDLQERQRLVPFAHVLLGGSHISTESTMLALDTSDSAFTWGVGGGVDYQLADQWSARAQFDWLRTRFFDEGQNDTRIGLGIVYRWGDR